MSTYPVDIPTLDDLDDFETEVATLYSGERGPVIQSGIITVTSEEPPRLLFGATVRSLPDILSRKILPPVWEVDPLVVRGQRVMLVGQWGAYKSWLFQGLALSLASAPGTWLGFPIPERRRVLYLDKEMSEISATRRLQRLAKGMGLDPREEYPFDLVSHPRFTMSQEGGTRLLQALDSIKSLPQVIFIETFRRVLGGKENDQDAVSAFWDQTTPIFKAGITLHTSHHMRKPRKKREDSRTMASGSTDILAGADTVLAVNRGVQSPAKTVLWLEHMKGRDTGEFLEGRAFQVTVKFGGGDKDGPVTFEAVTIKDDDTPLAAAQRNKAEQAKLTMLAAVILDQTVTTGHVLEAAKAYGGQRVREEWLKELIAEGQLVRNGRGVISRPAGGPA